MPLETSALVVTRERSRAGASCWRLRCERVDGPTAIAPRGPLGRIHRCDRRTGRDGLTSLSRAWTTNVVISFTCANDVPAPTVVDALRYPRAASGFSLREDEAGDSKTAGTWRRSRRA